MTSGFDDGDDAVPNESMEEIDMLLQVSAGKLCKSSDPAAFLDWIADAGPLLAPKFASGIDPRTGPIGNAFRALGVPLYNAMPLPDAGFRTRPLPKPGRNDPCSCGSGRKFKQCCQPLGELMDFSRINLLRYVLQNIPKKRYAELPDTQVDVHAVAHVAVEWNDEGEAKDAVALLEPWFAPGRKLRASAELLFDQLMESYLQLGREKKREALVQMLLASGVRELRAAAMQRRAVMLSDRGRYDEAWTAFRDAQREDPDNPSIGLLEVTLLMGSGETQQARERARFWAARLERARDPDLAPALQFMRKVAADPSATFAEISSERNPDVGRLTRLLAAAPAPAAHYDVQTLDDISVLAAKSEMAAVEADWREVYPQEKPALTFTQLDSQHMWDDASAWLQFLEKTPLAWHSLDVLDDLVMAVESLAELGLDTTLLEPLLARGKQVLEANLDAAGSTRALPWMCMENRPALRMLAHQAFRALDAASHDPSRRSAFIADARRMLMLNPSDNHGLRGPLSQCYLELGEPQQALQLCEAYPEDGECEIALNRVLALHDLGRRGEALRALEALPRFRFAAVKLLLAANPKPPRQGRGATVEIGGVHEAWEYRSDHHALWARNGALEWLRSAWRALRR